MILENEFRNKNWKAEFQVIFLENNIFFPWKKSRQTNWKTIIKRQSRYSAGQQSCYTGRNRFLVCTIANYENTTLKGKIQGLPRNIKSLRKPVQAPEKRKSRHIRKDTSLEKKMQHHKNVGSP